MMIVGILSMQRVINYGSFLQAYALKKILEELGCEVYFIDIEKGHPTQNIISENRDTNEIEINASQSRSIKRRVSDHFIKRIIAQFHRKQLRKVIEDAQVKYLYINAQPQNGEYDLVIIGSDEVFNCCQGGELGLSKQLFGDVGNASKIITYAASCGFAKPEYLINSEVAEIKHAMENISSFSVRDVATQKFVAAVDGREALLNLDPVLIYEFSRELTQIKEVDPSNYLVIYAYQNRINDPEEIRGIKNLAKKMNLRIISLGQEQIWCDYRVVTPFELLWWISKAGFVVSDTFHGTILGAKYNRPMCIMIRKSNENKLGYLTEKLCIGDLVIKNNKEIERFSFSDSVYNRCNTIIREEQYRAKEYLKNELA